MPARSYYAIKHEIDSFRGDIGRDILVYTPTQHACSICTSGGYFDTFTNKSVFIKCPECRGEFWRDDFDENTILARVHWTTNEAMNMTPGGRYFTGDAYAVIDPEFHTIVQGAQADGYLMIDGQRMNISKISPEGAQSINRYKLILKGAGNRPE